MTIKDHSLLPDNKSSLERGLELAFSSLLYDIKSPFPSLLDPQKTQPHILPHLAQERGVPEWDAAAPESEKRISVSNIWPVRRFAGTKKGIRLAVESLEYDAEITPEYKSGGNPYAFNVIAWRRENAPIGQSVVRRLHDHINDAKSERDEFSLTLALGSSSGFSVSGAVGNGLSMVKQSPQSAMPASPISHSVFRIAGGFRGYTITNLSPGSTL